MQFSAQNFVYLMACQIDKILLKSCLCLSRLIVILNHATEVDIIMAWLYRPWGNKTFFMLNSTEHEISNAHTNLITEK